MTRHTPTREDDTDDPTHTRRHYLGGLSTGVAAALTPAATETLPFGLSDPEAMSELATTYGGLFGGEATEIAIEHGNARNPSWPLVYEEGKRDSLETWLTESDDRELLSEHQPSRAATVIAPPGDIRSMAANGWIEGVDINFEASYVDPVDNLASRVENNGLGLTSFQRQLVGVLSDLPTTAGLATDTDAEAVTPAQVRQIINADSEAVTSLDTSTITVAVVDTGFNPGSGDILGDRPSDADYSPRLLPASKSMIADETVADSGLSTIEDGAGHGSFVASQILGNPTDSDYQGLCPNANLLAVKALGDDGGGTMADIANGIRYAAEQGADVICMSLGSPQYGTDIAAALEYAVEQGSIPVAATGNDRQATRWVATPASSEDAIGVGATTGDPPAEAQSAYFSNIGPHPGTTDLSAGATNGAMPAVATPGMKIKAKVGQPNGSTTVETLSGTSMAAPLVAGVVGLLLASDSSLEGEFDDVRSRLRDHARPIPAAGTTEVDAGMIDADAAITGHRRILLRVWG
jgi:subtilisin family serine protease